MKAFLAILILGVCCVALTQGLFFKSKAKSGCDPNPCKNKATCVKDAKNPNISTCVCVGEYHGKNCELKTGCNGNPCRKGVCMNDKVNPSKFHCKCNGSFVGPKCDIADACVKSPCKNGGACSLDEKYKPQCACKLGFGDKYCSSRNCTITTFKGKQFTKSSPKVYIDESIEPKMKNLDELAHLCKVHLHILKSFVLHHDPKQANQLDLKDKANPGHYIGQAISFHVYDLDDKLVCNDICLGKLPIPQQGAKCFVDGLHAINWKWSILDPTVVSTNYHLGNTVGYNKLREFHQVGCKDKKFSN